jgi:RND family efflux transporter MFP subunit
MTIFSGGCSKHWLLAALGCIITALAGCGGGEEAVERKAAPIPVEVVQARKGAIVEKMEATGRLAPFVRIKPATKVQGRVLSVPFDEGDTVRAGQVLVEIDAMDIRAQMAQAEAAKQEARATLKRLEANRREAEAVLTNAKAHLQRIRSLFNREATTAEAFDKAVADEAVARAKVEALEAEKSVVSSNMEMARARIEEASSLLNYATIEAPMDSVVISKQVEPGDMSVPGVPLLTLEDISRVKAELIVPEEDIPHVTEGQKVDISIDALGQQSFTGEVETIIPSGDPGSHAFMVKVILDNPDRRLKPGMFVRAGIVRMSKDDALLVPLNALREEGHKRFVFRVVEGQASRVDVETGLRSLTEVEVLSGLSAGDKVVTRGKENLTSQSAVRVIGS